MVSSLATVYSLSAAAEDSAKALAPLIQQTWSLATMYKSGVTP